MTVQKSKYGLLKKSPLIIGLILFYSCKPAPRSSTVTITKTANNAVKLSGLDLTTIQALGSDSAFLSAWQSFIPVYKMPADTDLKDFQPVQPGKYVVLDSLVIFTPDTPLQKGQTYFARYYQFDKGSLWNQVKDRQKLTHRPYTDLVLKP